MLFGVYTGGQNLIKDAFTDLKYFKNSQQLVLGHTGFFNAYKLVEKEILQTLSPYKDMPLYITGHSLGNGALSMLATRFLPSDNITYTFGCPRAADEEFFKYSNT